MKKRVRDVKANPLLNFIDVPVVKRSLLLIVQAAPKEVAGLVFATVLFGSGPAILLWLGKLIIDEIGKSSPNSLTFWTWMTQLTPVMVFGVVGFLTVNLILDGVETFLSFQLSTLRDRIKIVAQQCLFEKTVELPSLAVFENPHLLNLLTLAEASIPKLQQLAMVLSNLMGGLFVVIPTILLSITIAWWIPIVVFLVSLPSVYYQFHFEERQWSVESAQAPIVRKMDIHAEVLTKPIYAKELRMYGLADYFLRSWKELIRGAFAEMQAVRRSGSIATLLWSTVSGMGTGLSFIYVVFQTARGELTIGDLALFSGLVFQVRRGLFILVGNLANVRSIALATNPLFEFLDYQETKESRPRVLDSLSVTPTLSITRTAGSAPSISMVDVSFTYPGAKACALQGINLEIAAGETLVIVGENGAGKTTLAKLICRLYEPSDGKLLVNGIDYRTIDLESFRRDVAVVFQDFVRFPSTLRENIGFGDLNRMDSSEAILEAARQIGLAEVCSSLPIGLDTLLSKQFEGGVDLSGGQWQRVAIARALMRSDARIVILDEPTASLDPQTEYEALSMFRNMARSRTSLIISHRLSLARIAHKVVVMHQGKIVEEGTHESLLHDGKRYSMMFKQQASSYFDTDLT